MVHINNVLLNITVKGIGYRRASMVHEEGKQWYRLRIECIPHQTLDVQVEASALVLVIDCEPQSIFKSVHPNNKQTVLHYTYKMFQ